MVRAGVQRLQMAKDSELAESLRVSFARLNRAL